ncbi:DUF3800 domain-containing protein [Algihabitans albus]|uniref:DUF3800 domain-containing protein n=1 Tax=Algihabitans albus TaxID=2164067 RepID=UPI000E5D8BA4|nr:DUF3800 domain-containing protein [Algihabitans albus]
MYLLYYDEVKHEPPKQTSFWLGGICDSAEVVPALEAELNEISQDAFGSATLSRDTEFHGIELCRGKGNFKGRNFDERLEYLKRILNIISRDDIQRVYIRIIPENITHSSKPPDEIAFMYLIEKADSLFKKLGTVGMLFGDYDEPNIGTSVASLSLYRQGGTRWERGRDIENIIDTVHFARSHHSRMIQLADVFLYCLQFYHQDNSARWRKAIEEVIDNSGIRKCQEKRVWPSEPTWYRL